jgi:non-ribosomal peptide synthetase component F
MRRPNYSTGFSVLRLGDRLRQPNESVPSLDLAEGDLPRVEMLALAELHVGGIHYDLCVLGSFVQTCCDALLDAHEDSYDLMRLVEVLGNHLGYDGGSNIMIRNRARAQEKPLRG